nr:hypothetical protein [Latilactobacillus sakei]
MLTKIRMNWFKISLVMIVIGLLIMGVSYTLSGFDGGLFQEQGSHDWFRTFNF